MLTAVFALGLHAELRQLLLRLHRLAMHALNIASIASLSANIRSYISRACCWDRNSDPAGVKLLAQGLGDLGRILGEQGHDLTFIHIFKRLGLSQIGQQGCLVLR
ncbi:MAG: hypothetical protein R3B96_21140 [Pirellulaceae bacterium]